MRSSVTADSDVVECVYVALHYSNCGRNRLAPGRENRKAVVSVFVYVAQLCAPRIVVGVIGWPIGLAQQSPGV